MLPRERVLAVFQHEVPDRVPVVPKIWIDLAANALEIPYLDVTIDPAVAPRAIVDAPLKLRCDGAHLFIYPERRIEQGGQKGNFILGSGCGVPRGARLENLSILKDAAEQYGSYDAGVLVRNR